MIVIRFDWQLDASNVDLISRTVMFFSFLQSSYWDKDKEFKHKESTCRYSQNFILRASATKSQKSAEKVESSRSWKSFQMDIASLNMSFVAQNFTKIQGPFPKKHVLFSSKAIHYCKPSSFYLPNMKKYGTYQIILKKNQRVALFLECKP